MSNKAKISIHGFELEVRSEAALFLRFPAQYGIEELEAFLVELRSFFVERGRGPFQLQVDVSQVDRSNAMTRKRLGEFFVERGPYFEANCRAMAIVTSSSVQKGAITAVFWLRPNRWKTKVFSSQAQADAWLLEQAQL